MNKSEAEIVKTNLLKIVGMWLLVGAAMTLPASCVKAVHAFYTQVVAKDTPAE